MLYLEPVLERKFFELLGHELGYLIREHCRWYPIFCLEQADHVTRRQVQQLLHYRKCAEVIGD